MKQGRTLPDLAAELERQANAKRDFLAPAQTIRLRSNGHTELYLNEPFEVGEIAHGQIAEYAGVPKALYDRLRNAAADLRVPVAQLADCPQAIPDEGQLAFCKEEPLFDVMLNRLLRQGGGEKRLVRTLDGKARAFLSSSFNPDLVRRDS